MIGPSLATNSKYQKSRTGTESFKA
uniref:Uncharacterized protein n=1 Tax=Rhizophora mucronata TaxID=61149 RepID=A0A2P2P098_RHIMU